MNWDTPATESPGANVVPYPQGVWRSLGHGGPRTERSPRRPAHTSEEVRLTVRSTCVMMTARPQSMAVKQRWERRCRYRSGH
jgi:hypothetical protein